jgi:predicted membrane protein
MRKTLLIASIVFVLISIVFSVLPLDTLALLPIGIALLLIFLTFKKSDVPQRKIVKILFAITYICALFVIGKTYFIKDEIATDQKFEQEKIETKQEAKQELEDLEKDLEGLE